ncbi:hypothetical protein OAM01_00610 [bacterium]|nr:hypothetical protein [bacterium]
MKILRFSSQIIFYWLFLSAVTDPSLLRGAQPLFFEEGFRDFSSSWDIALGDLDNDGDLDAAMLGGIYVNDGKAVSLLMTQLSDQDEHEVPPTIADGYFGSQYG